MSAKIFFIAISLIPFALNPFGSNLFELPKLQLAALILFVTAIFGSILLILRKETKISFHPYIFILLGVWLFSLICSTIFSIAPELSFYGSYDRVQGLYSHLIYLSYFLIFLQLFTQKASQDFFLKATILAGFLAGIHGLLQQFGIGVFSPSAMSEFLGRSFATLGHPNFLGQFLILPFWASIYFFLNTKNQKLPYLFGAITIFAALLLTENRASILGVIVGAIFLTSISTDLLKKYRYYFYVGLPLIFIGFITFVAPSLRSLSTRFYLWQGSLSLIPDHPFIGSGLETFELVFQKVSTIEFFKFEQLYTIADRAHNEYLDILVNQGMLGLIAYLSCILGALYLVLKNRENRGVVIMGTTLVSILVSNFFSFSLTIHWLYLMAVIALVLANSLTLKKIIISKNLITLFCAGIIFATSIIGLNYGKNALLADNYYKAGVQNIYDGKFEQGIGAIYHATELNPHQADISFHLADILFMMGKELGDTDTLNSAETALSPAGVFTGNSFRYLFAMARIKAYLKDFPASEQLYAKASTLAPTNPIILKEWGAMYYLKGDYSKAIEKMEQFLASIPDYWKNKNSLSKLSPQYQEKYRLFMKHVPDFSDLCSYLARSYAEINNPKMARFYLQFVEDDEAIETTINILKEKRPR